MSKVHVQNTDSTDAEVVPVRLRNIQGRSTVPLSITIPKELNQTINGIHVKTGKSKSLVITELLEKGLRLKING